MTVLWFSLVGVMAALSWRHALSQSPVRVGRPETPARTVQMSSVAPEHAPEPSSRRLGGVATLAPGRGWPEPQARQLSPSSVSEPGNDGLGQMSRAEGEAARDAVPAPPGRAAGVHVDPRGPQPQGVAS